MAKRSKEPFEGLPRRLYMGELSTAQRQLNAMKVQEAFKAECRDAQDRGDAVSFDNAFGAVMLPWEAMADIYDRIVAFNED